jgi:hypothetical protein
VRLAHVLLGRGNADSSNGVQKTMYHGAGHCTGAAELAVRALLDLPRFGGHLKTGGNSLRKEPTMPRSRPAYPREFREEAVRLARSSARAIAQIARELGSPGGP